MALESSRMRPLFLLSLIAAFVVAMGGCDVLTGGSKSSDDDAAEDDSSSKKKKKGKGKKGKKKKGKKKKKPDDDDGDATPPPSPEPTPAPDTKVCVRVVKTLECMRDKMPPDARASMDKSIEDIKRTMKNIGPHSTKACESMLKGMDKSARQQGCMQDGSAPDRPAPLPPSPAPTPSPSPSPSPTTKSAPPSTSEWASVTKEVVVHGSSTLNCETKMKREWLRVSCRGRNHTGGTPVSVSVTKGGGKFSDFVHSGPAVTSLVVRFVEGVDVEAKFTWTDRTHTLHVFWPSQSPEPPFKGKFKPLPTR